MKRTSLNPRNLTHFFRTHAATITLMLAVVFAGVLVVGVLLVNASDQGGLLTDWDTSTPTDAPTNTVSDHTDTSHSRLASVTSWTPTNNTQYSITESDGPETSTELLRTCSIDQGNTLLRDSHKRDSLNSMATGGITSERSSLTKSGITDLLDNRHTPVPNVSDTFANFRTDALGFAGTNGLDANMHSYLGTDNTGLTSNPAIAILPGSKTKHK